MLTVLIFTHNSEKLLATTLAALVPAVVSGLLRRVSIMDDASTDRTKLLSDEAGCSFYALKDLPVALDAVRTQWVLLLKPGTTLPDDWEIRVSQHMQNSVATARLLPSNEAVLARIKRLLGWEVSTDSGLLVRTEALHTLILSGVTIEDWSREIRCEWL